MSSRLDIIIFGASGFTGKQVIPQICKFAQPNGRLSYSWGVAGRSEEKLRSVLSEAAKKLGVALQEIPIVIADVAKGESLERMAQRARVVINCSGPYHICGKPVIEACLASGAHYVDASWEPQFIDDVYVKYYKEAEEKGVYVVSACGFDSIPSDLGVIFLQDHFQGEVHLSLIK